MGRPCYPALPALVVHDAGETHGLGRPGRLVRLRPEVAMSDDRRTGPQPTFDVVQYITVRHPRR